MWVREIFTSLLPRNWFHSIARSIFWPAQPKFVIVSDPGHPEFIAADLVAQAEHDPEALAVFITTQERLASDVARAAEKLSTGNAVARQSLRRNGVILVSASRRESFAWANEIAAEHLTVATPADLALVRNAGSVFVGEYSPQAAGDYASGPNHVLPTGGAARFRGGLERSGFCEDHQRAEIIEKRSASDFAGCRIAGERGGVAGPCGIDPPEVCRCLKRATRCSICRHIIRRLGGRDGLRLDFNENTVGCSPRVLARLQEITAEEIGRYPERAPVERIVGDYLGD